MFKSLNNSLYEILVNLFNEKDKNSIIEPLICLTRLGILEFKPIGTKISIFNNKISYNEPNVLQGALRWSNGDGRDDLHNIFLPITKASVWYDVRDENIKSIFLFGIRGLERLKQSYSKNSTINHSIQYYIEYLKKSIRKAKKNNSNNGISGAISSNLGTGPGTGTSQESASSGDVGNSDVVSGGSGGGGVTLRSGRNSGSNKANSKTSKEDNSNDNSDNSDNSELTSEEHNTIFNKLKGIWNDREISIINNLLVEMETRRQHNRDEADSIISTLETLLSSKEARVQDLILRSTTLLE